MRKQILEYVWLDNNSTLEGKFVRSKTKVVETKESFQEFFEKDMDKYPMWNYDGSSTGQAETHNSELYLKPVARYKDPFRRKENGIVVLCEVYDGKEPHTTNTRKNLREAVQKLDPEAKTKYGFEQEYVLTTKVNGETVPYGVSSTISEVKQGPYYCGNGNGHVAGRNFVDDHLEHCLYADLNISGTNAEVLLGQWEYQLGPVGPLTGADDLWISRWILQRLTENENFKVVLDPKPFLGTEYNGSGMHVNFSTEEMRNPNSERKKAVVEAAVSKLRENHKKHMDVYGSGNDNRLTGHNETCDINTFKSGMGDRTASIRIPRTAFDQGANTYIEDRRPASNADPYQIVWALLTTVLG
jgi:glutamine synthetase